ncbi:hypothetical protein [Janthinobacterium agaricidamnosum]|uniref:Uncharacterized protein n=1 Tax=Janthinobacterium agaricidamnosum NBRC 102515 = DSM 9628 TaxID=1349767 RepID=W0VC06_9BURK|nr:hypothetical protein [Janthinobacterium agaricidamnosum]CDG84837.1 hypothetical protein GJA_4227 [Janthinobacterium agaricidamnosum NBRC 102515 = DSM 9628]
MLIKTSENMIAQIIADTVISPAGPREQHILSQTLHGLVRLAKSEQMLAIKMDVERAAGISGAAAGRRHSKSILRKIGADCDARQGQFLFDREDRPGQE